MKKIALLFAAFLFTTVGFAQHDVYLNFSDFLVKLNSAGYRYHVTQTTSLGGNLRFGVDPDVSQPSRMKNGTFFQGSAEYLIYFNPRNSCDRFYVGPNLSYRFVRNNYESEIYNFPQEVDILKYTTTQEDLILSLSIGSTWRHHSGFFFNANFMLGRSLMTEASISYDQLVFDPEKGEVSTGVSLNIGWQFGKRSVKDLEKIK